jgi:diaminopimelate epimerase
LKFTKMQGAGNDFVVVEANDSIVDWQKMSIVMCDRHFGIGADGLLVISPSLVADLRMNIFNADGSEAATCGNGIRCVVKYYIESSRLKNGKRQLSVETQSGIRQAWVYLIGSDVQRVKVSMGKPSSFREGSPNKVDFTDKLDISNLTYQFKIDELKTNMIINLVSIGNRHAVYFTDAPVRDFQLSQIALFIERKFPSGINFEVARVIKEKRIEARVWENGVGETLACGSGACAIGVAARIHGFINDSSEIELPGGILLFEWEKGGEVFLTGPVQRVFEGEWPDVGFHKNDMTSPKRDKNEVLA